MNALGIALLKKYENEPLSVDGKIGLSATWDTIGRRWTIGYGHTGVYPSTFKSSQRTMTAGKSGKICTYRHVTNGDRLASEIIASMLLIDDVDIREQTLLPKLPQLLNTNQTAAITCLAYNVGIGAVLNSHLLESIRKGDRLLYIKPRWLSWDHGLIHNHETVIADLLKRRKAEWGLFTTPIKG